MSYITSKSVQVDAGGISVCHFGLKSGASSTWHFASRRPPDGHCGGGVGRPRVPVAGGHSHRHYLPGLESL